MVLKDIIYTLWRNLEGGFIPDDTRFTYKSIRTVVLGCIGDAALDLAFKLRNADPDDPYPRYYNEYESEVKFDPQGNCFYSEIKGKSLTFDGNRSFDITLAEDYMHRFAVDLVPTNSREWFLLKKLPPVPKVVYYLIGTNRVIFTADMSEIGSVKISQGFSVPTEGNEDEDVSVIVPDEIGRAVLINALNILNANVRQSDRANDGVPLN